MSEPRRQLTLVDCFGLGVNGIVGSGIFLLPSVLYRRAGGASPLAWLLIGGLALLIALSFAEAAGRTDRSGGPYRYACDAFGPHAGFVVGWITAVSSVLGFAAVARGFAEHAATLVGVSAVPGIAVALVLLLGALNAFGVKPSARAGDAIGVAKLVGLGLFVAVGLFHLRAGAFAAPPSPLAHESVGLGAAAFAGMFAITGFEYVPVPAGETQHPQRAVALALVGSVLGATLLYALVQTVAVGTCANLGVASTPLVDAARAFAGAAGGTAMAACGVISAFGFCSGSALVVPRYLELFAQDGFLPAALDRRSSRRQAPLTAIAVTSLTVGALALCLDFKRLIDVSTVAAVAQYLSTCLAVPMLRRRYGPSPGFRLPLGPAIPLLAAAGSALFFVSVAARELKFAALWIATGLALALLTRRAKRL